MTMESTQGSNWAKWDLHIHVPNGKLSDDYTTDDGSDPLDKFCDEIEKSDAQVFGVSDYFSVDSLRDFDARFRAKYPNSKKRYFLNIEVRLNETVNKQLEEVNVHLLFNPDSAGDIEKFLSKLKVTEKGHNDKIITCTELKTKEQFESATVSRDSINQAFEDTFGSKAIRPDHLLVITAANNDGIRAESGKKRKEIISDEIDKFSDAFFGNYKNAEYFLNPDRYESELEASPKPVVSGSDCHSFKQIDDFLGKRFVEEKEKDGKKEETIIKDITWIKAEPTYEGLKQILYEPKQGDRAFIGQVKPDVKNDYQVIRKIVFKNSKDFPDEIEFNNNLCSIIGSRSSGKSALLAYMAHSVDPVGVENVIEGPGEGEQYKWSRIKEDYSIEWANGKSNAEAPGKIVFIPQNYLYNESRNPEEIKEKIVPVLFKRLPSFKVSYDKTLSALSDQNQQISEIIEDWFSLHNTIRAIEEKLKQFGDKSSIEGQKKSTEAKISALKEKYSLSEKELETYQNITKEKSDLEERIRAIESELQLLATKDEVNFFLTVKVQLMPSLSTLPAKLQTDIKQYIESQEQSLIQEASGLVTEYKKAIEKEKENKKIRIVTIEQENADLFKKYEKNGELQSLVTSVSGYSTTLATIEGFETSKKETLATIADKEKKIADCINKRLEVIKDLDKVLKESDQGEDVNIVFDIEYSVAKEDLDVITHGINMRALSDYVERGSFNLDLARKNSAKFLFDIYTGKQKINNNYDKKKISKDILGLTEKILFTAQMEGDKIGGFSQPTMTPGKRALFALRLILEESEDTWPLLIDQPEDDLDSRSIYDEVVPFLKEKKKERQIIMVSHNANLVIGADSEQIVIANRHGNDRQNEDGKQFNYLTGSLENSQKKDESCKDTLKSQGICEHACSILDGGKIAFETRKNKYQIH